MKASRQREYDAWLADVEARHKEWDRLAAIAEQERQDSLNARCPESEGWHGAKERWGWRIRARRVEDAAADIGSYI